jgi:protein-tyrosine phosphatase
MKKLHILALGLALLGSSAALAQKNLGMETSPNFRELGGVQINEEYKIKEDMIYRSGSFSHLPAGDEQKLLATSINRVVDFRSPFEIEREPDHIPASMNAKYVPCQIGEVDPKSMGQFMKVVGDKNFTPKKLDSLMVMMNRTFVDNITDYAPFFESLQEPDAVVLFHCSAGKDRTGLASSLFLHILGADWDIIMADFLRSNEAVSKLDPQKLAAYGIPVEAGKHLMGVQPEYLESAWAGITEKYGSIDAMLEKEFGIGEKEIKALRKKYLEKV